MEKIKIMNGDLISGHLFLSDNGHTNAKRKETIKWKIEDNSNVACIESIYVKSEKDNVFSELKRVNDKMWMAEINKDAPVYAKCEYAIKWKGYDERTRTHDPIIAIKPTSFLDPLLKVALLISAPILLLLSFNLFFKNRK